MHSFIGIDPDRLPSADPIIRLPVADGWRSVLVGLDYSGDEPRPFVVTGPEPARSRVEVMLAHMEPEARRVASEVHVLLPTVPAEGLTLTSANPMPEYLPTREELRARLAAGHLPRLPDDVGPHEPYAPGWRPGHLRRWRMTSLAWAVVR